MSIVWNIQSWSSCTDCADTVEENTAKAALQRKKARSDFNNKVAWKTASDRAKEVRNNNSPDGYARGKYKPSAPPSESPSKTTPRDTPPTQRNALPRIHRQTDLSYKIVQSALQGKEEEEKNN